MNLNNHINSENGLDHRLPENYLVLNENTLISNENIEEPISKHVDFEFPEEALEDVNIINENIPIEYDNGERGITEDNGITDCETKAEDLTVIDRNDSELKSTANDTGSQMDELIESNINDEKIGKKTMQNQSYTRTSHILLRLIY